VLARVFPNVEQEITVAKVRGVVASRIAAGDVDITRTL